MYELHERRRRTTSPNGSRPITTDHPIVPQSHRHHYQHHQQRTAANLSDMMKRLLAKPAPPGSVIGLPSTPLGISLGPEQTNDNNHENQNTCRQEISMFSAPQTSDSTRLPNEFDKSIRALDLVGDIDISMPPISTTTEPGLVERGRGREPASSSPTLGSGKRQRNVLRRRPSGNAKAATTSPYLLESPSTPRIGQQIFKDVFNEGTTISTPLVTPLHPPPHQFPRRHRSKSPSPSTRPKISSSINLASPSVKPAPNDHTTPPTGDKIGVQSDDAANVGFTKLLTRSVSGKWKRNDCNHQIRSQPSAQELSRLSVDKDGEMLGDKRRKLGKSPVSPNGSGDGGDNPSRRLWKLVKKFSVGGLREKSQADSAPPVPPLPTELANDSLQRQHRTLHTSRSSDFSLVQPRWLDTGGPTTPLAKAHKTAPSTAPPILTQHHSKSRHSPPHLSSPQPTTGPRPSTTSRSSSPSSDVASSQFFNRTHSAQSSTSSFGEEVIPFTPLSTTSVSTTTAKSKTNDTSTSRHIIPPAELIRNHSTSNYPTDTNSSTAMPIPPLPPPPPSMDDDWTIVRSPSVELEALSLPPPPRPFLKGVGLNRKGVGNQGCKTSQTQIGVISASKMLKMANVSSEKVDENSRDVFNTSPSSIRSDKRKDLREVDENSRDVFNSSLSSIRSDKRKDLREDEKSTDGQQGDKEEDVVDKNQSFGYRDLDLSESPTIPSFSTSSAINSFPVRRASPSLPARSSPIAVSPATSNGSSGGGGGGSVSSTFASPSRSSLSSPRTAFGRVRQHLFGTNDVRINTEDDEKDDEALILPPSNRKSDIQLPHLKQLYSPHHYPQQQQEVKVKPRNHHRHSSGSTNTIAKSRSTHTASTISGSTPPSPVITFHPHRRSMSFHTSSPALAFFSPRSPSSPVPSMPSPLPPLSPASPLSECLTSVPDPSSPTPSMGHRTRSSSHLRSGFSSKKLSEVLFSSSSSSPSPGSRSSPRSRSSSASGPRTLTRRSISIRTSNQPSTPTAPIPSLPRSQLTEQEKDEKWNDLLARSARAGGTLHLAAGSRLLGSDDI